MNKKNAAIVLGSTKNFFYATGPVVLNIKKFSPHLADDIVIYYDDIADRDREILVDELGCRLIPYDCPLKVGSEATAALQRFTLLSFSIYEIFALLDEYQKVLWLDSDICIQGDISGVFDFGPVGIRHGGAKLESAMGGKRIDPALDDLPTNNTGVVLVTDELPDYHSLREQCYLYTEKFLDTLRLPDQAILNYVLFKNNISINNLGDTYNYTVHHPLHGFAKAKIFHLACDVKFWNHSVLRNMFPVWEECYQTWLDLGGSAYEREQQFMEVGNNFSLIDMLAAMQAKSHRETALEVVVKEQDETIKLLSKNVEELLALLENVQSSAGRT